jgi:diguanylate cyclase (GGDEF)-like protein
MHVFAFWDLTIQLPMPVALATVAAVGYLMGRRGAGTVETVEDQNRRELKRAQHVAKELEKIAETIRQQLATHHASIVQFKDRVFSFGVDKNEASWQELCKEAENMVRPTMKLANQLASAYDEIRQQSGYLMSFTEVRTDALTGVSNRRALDETLTSHLALMHRYETPFTVVVLDIDHFKKINEEQGHPYGDTMLAAVAKHLADNVRDTDIVTRYGGEEFVIVMPQTMVEGACIFANRLRERVESSLPLTISGGAAAALDGDTVQSLLARADAALYGAKAAGRNRVFYHNGVQIEAYEPESQELDRIADDGRDDEAARELVLAENLV